MALLSFSFVFLLALTNAVSARLNYELREQYLPSTFFDQFDFFVSNYSSNNIQDVDPTQGFVNYRNRSFAEAHGLIKTTPGCAYIHANSKDVFNGTYGRDSIRIESKRSYTHGLFIWTFDHLPKPACGVWPAVWSYGPNWPNSGEMDVYENWNLATSNLITGHTNGASSCTISPANFTGVEGTPDCNTYAPTQYYGQGCSVTEQNGQWGHASGGVYAMEWTSDAISVWSWPVVGTPFDVTLHQPDPSSWGQPHFQIVSSLCNIDQMFANHSLVMNIDFCGTTAGNPSVWSLSGCPVKQYPTCQSYVGANPQAFADVYFGVKGIDIYTSFPSQATTTSSSTSSAAWTTSTTTTTTTESKPYASSTLSSVTVPASSQTGSASIASGPTATTSLVSQTGSDSSSATWPAS